MIRWPGVIKPGTVFKEIFASLDWLPTFVDIAGGVKGDELKKKIEKGAYTGIVKTTLDGVDQLDYLRASRRSLPATPSFTTPARHHPRCATRIGRCITRWCRPGHRRLDRGRDLSLDSGRQHQTRSLRDGDRADSRHLLAMAVHLLVLYRLCLRLEHACPSVSSCG